MIKRFLSHLGRWPKPLWLRQLLRAVLLLVLPRTIRFKECQLALHPRDHVISSALWLGHYEDFSTELFLQSLAPGQTVVDLGANIGIYTCLAARGVGPTGRVVAFEPDPENFACLEKSIRLNGFTHVQAEQLALSDQEGTARLYRSSLNMGDHRLQPAEETRESIEITTRRFDAYWQETQGGLCTPIHLLKMDVQGAEGLVLQGMGQTLANSPQLKIFLEFWPEGLRQAGTDPLEMLRNLQQLGFHLHLIEQEAGRLIPVTAPETLICPGEKYVDLYLDRQAPTFSL